MKTLNYAVGGHRCYVRSLESDEDAGEFFRWLGTNRIVAVDTETTGLDVYSPTHRVRLVQFGSDTEAFVLRADQFRKAIVTALHQVPYLVMHNAAYDMAVLDRHGFATLEELRGRTFDTGIMAHLLDPRGRQEGGTGHGLKDLAVHYLDPDADTGQKVLHAVFRTEYKANSKTGWALIDVGHPEYIRYAGADVLLTMRLFRVLKERVMSEGMNGLSTFEHRLQGITTGLTKRGMLVDSQYTEQLAGELWEEAEKYRAIAESHGVDNINSTKQVADALMAMGWTPTEFTKTGPKVDKGVLLPLAGLTGDWQPIDGVEPNPLAEAVLRAKRAEKWSVAYVQKFMQARDAYGRIHPSIHSLQARTGRMSLSDPPLQQLPSGDWRIRRCMVADPGNVVLSVDFSQVEMRVLAGLSGDETMMEAIRTGTDLHDYTAALIFGPDFTKSQRKLAKGVGFGKVYGGGAETLSRQTGADIDAVRATIRAYDATYRGIRRYSKRLQERVEYGAPEVITPTGRRLPVDRNRAYSSVNYMVQSTARDLLAQSLVDVVDAGLEQYLLLPIHDELLGQAPEADAKEIAQAIKEHMTTEFAGVSIVADAEVGGRSWGSLYGAKE